jgi:hypothetical protein
MEELQATNSNLPSFDYSKVDMETANYLQDRYGDMQRHYQKARYEIACELAKAHDLLAKKGYGCFYEWCESIGFDGNTVKKELRFYNLIGSNLPKQPLIESLPKSLQDEIARPSAPPELQQKVFDGEITTHKQWQAEKKALQDRAEQAEARADQAEQENAALTEQYDAQAQEIAGYKDTIRRQADEIANGDSEELAKEKQKRIEAEQQIAWLKQNPPEPKDYRANKRRIEELERDVATYKAHEEGLTLQQKAMIDAEVAKYKNTASEEIHKSMRIMDLVNAVMNLPKNMEIADYAESHIRQSVGAEARAKAEIEKVIIDLQVIHDELDKYIHKERKLQVVK